MEKLIGLFGLTQHDLFAAGIGALMCLGVTQIIKNVVKMTDFAKRITAFVAGWVATYTLVPPFGFTPDYRAFWLAAVVGLITPWGFAVLKKVGKHYNWQWVIAL